jgi:ankyrin repeat protein
MSTIILKFYFLLFYLYHIFLLLLQDGFTALIEASLDGHHQVVRTLLENGAAVNAQNKVRNLMMMMMMMIVLTIMMMMAIVFNDGDRKDNGDKRSMYW